MSSILDSLLSALAAYEQGQPKHLQHLMKVHAFARYIGHAEQLDEPTQFTLELAALVHDVGINPSRVKYQSSAGHFQQIEGPPVARRLLAPYALAPEVVDRVCALVARHHTYTGVDGLDHRILIEADFLVNLYEEGSDRQAAQAALDRCFVTATGRRLLIQQFLSGPA